MLDVEQVETFLSFLQCTQNLWILLHCKKNLSMRVQLLYIQVLKDAADCSCDRIFYVGNNMGKMYNKLPSRNFEVIVCVQLCYNSQGTVFRVADILLNIFEIRIYNKKNTIKIVPIRNPQRFEDFVKKTIQQF